MKQYISRKLNNPRCHVEFQTETEKSTKSSVLNLSTALRIKTNQRFMPFPWTYSNSIIWPRIYYHKYFLTATMRPKYYLEKSSLSILWSCIPLIAVQYTKWLFRLSPTASHYSPSHWVWKSILFTDDSCSMKFTNRVSTNGVLPLIFGMSTWVSRRLTSWRRRCRTRRSSWARRTGWPAAASRRTRSRPQPPVQIAVT